MFKQAVVAGGGIGGLAAALTVSRSGWHVRLLEREPFLSEFGAGIQLGPNVVRILHQLGLADALKAVAAFPDWLHARSIGRGETLGQLQLGKAMVHRYGAPYLTVHRSDLQALLLQAVQQTSTQLSLGRPLSSFSQTQNRHAITLKTSGHPDIESDLLIGADGVWSSVRQQLLGDGPPRRTGHLAYRALVLQADLPVSLRSQQVTVWLGPRMHVVQYPVRGGDWLNVVVLMQSHDVDASEVWDHCVSASDLANLDQLISSSCSALRDLVQAMGSVVGWRRWALHDRPCMQGAHQHAKGRVALLGDAAHPMRPYLAQGAGMAIEDAAELGQVLKLGDASSVDVSTLLQRYALNRWRRNARVQARALRNGEVFHLDGWMRVARDASMRLLGERVLDMPWLYGAADR